MSEEQEEKQYKGKGKEKQTPPVPSPTDQTEVGSDPESSAEQTSASPGGTKLTKTQRKNRNRRARGITKEAKARKVANLKEGEAGPSLGASPSPSPVAPMQPAAKESETGDGDVNMSDAGPSLGPSTATEKPEVKVEKAGPSPPPSAMEPAAKKFKASDEDVNMTEAGPPSTSLPKPKEANATTGEAGPPPPASAPSDKSKENTAPSPGFAALLASLFSPKKPGADGGDVEMQEASPSALLSSALYEKKSELPASGSVRPGPIFTGVATQATTFKHKFQTTPISAEGIDFALKTWSVHGRGTFGETSVTSSTPTTPAMAEPPSTAPMAAFEQTQARIRDLEAKLVHAEETIGEHENVVANHSQQLKEKDATVENLRKALDTANDHISTRDEELLNLGITGELTESINALIARNLEDHRLKHGADLDDLRQRLFSLETERDRLRDAHQEAMANRNGAEQELKIMADSFGDLSNSYHEVHQRMLSYTPEDQGNGDEISKQIQDMRTEALQLAGHHEKVKQELVDTKKALRGLQQRGRDPATDQSEGLANDASSSQSVAQAGQDIDKAIAEAKEPLETRIAELEAQLQSHTTSFGRDIADVRQQLDAERLLNQTRSADAQGLRNRLQELELQLETERNSLDEDKAELKRQLDLHVSQNEQHVNENAALKERSHQQDQRILAELQSNQTLKTDLEKMRAVAVELDEQIKNNHTSLKNENARLKRRLDETTSEEKQKLEQEKAKLEQERSEMQQQLDNEKAKLQRQLDDERSTLQYNFDVEKEKLKEKLDDQKTEHRQRIEDEMSGLKRQINAERGLNQGYTDEITTLNERIAQMDAEKESSKKNVKKQAEKDVATAQSMAETKAKEAATANSSLEHLKNEIAESLSMNAQRSSMSTLLVELNRTVKSCEEYKAEVKGLKEQIHEFRTLLEEKAVIQDQHIIDSGRQIDLIRDMDKRIQAMDGLRDQIAELKQQEETLKAQIKKLENQKVRSEANTEQRINKLKEELAEKDEQLAAKQEELIHQQQQLAQKKHELALVRPVDGVGSAFRRLRALVFHSSDNKLLLFLLTSIAVLLLALAWDYLSLTTLRSAMHYANAPSPMHPWHVLRNSGAAVGGLPRSQYGFDSGSWLSNLVGARNIWRLGEWTGVEWDEAVTMRLC